LAFSSNVEKEDIRIFSVDNKAGKYTPKTIEKTFEDAGFMIDGNNNMNAPFKPRFGKVFYKTYHLFTVHESKHTLALVKKNPKIGLITPLSMSIYSNPKSDELLISSLTLRGMSRITSIPMENKDLISYAKLLKDTIEKALPGGKFKKLSYEKVADMSKSLATTFEAEFEGETPDDRFDSKEDFEAEMEGELEPYGFLFPGFNDLASEFSDGGYDAYEFYDTYSICKLDVIYPIHQAHPEVGAFAPCTFYIYKKVDEKKVHMGFPSVDNWITATDLEDEKSLKPLVIAQGLIERIVSEVIEE